MISAELWKLDMEDGNKIKSKDQTVLWQCNALVNCYVPKDIGVNEPGHISRGDGTVMSATGAGLPVEWVTNASDPDPKRMWVRSKQDATGYFTLTNVGIEGKNLYAIQGEKPILGTPIGDGN